MDCKVQMLDGSEMSIDIDKKSTGQDLLEAVCKRIDLNEIDYFGFTFKDSKNQKIWVNAAKKLSRQIEGGPYQFSFQVKFYPPDPTILNEEITRYQLFLQLRCDVLDGSLPCSFLTLALLGSYAAQSQLGDYVLSDHGSGSDYLKEISFAPNQSQELLDKIADLHKTHAGTQPAEAELNYLENACKLSLYGVHTFNAKDDKGDDIDIAICASGILIFKQRLRIYRFTWPKILKISYRRNIFTVKIRPGEFEQMDTTMEYKTSSYQAAKRVWRMAVEHHGFFRLRETEPLPRGLFARFGPKYRYCGKTFYQAQQVGDKSQGCMSRVVGRKFVGSKSMETVLTGYSTERSEAYQPDGSRTATLDLKKRRQNSLHDITSENDQALSSATGECYTRPGVDTWSGWEGSRRQLVERDARSRSATSDEASFPLEPYQPGHRTDGYRTYGSNAYGGDAGTGPRRNNQYDMLYEQGGSRGGEWDHINSDTMRSYTMADGTKVTEYQSHREGIIETRIEKRYPDGGYSQSVDYDKNLTDAILAVTEVDTNMTVEKIEIQTGYNPNASAV